MNAALEGVSGQQHASAELYPLGKFSLRILKEAGWARGPVWTDLKSRLHRDSSPDSPNRSSVAIPTELPAHKSGTNK